MDHHSNYLLVSNVSDASFAIGVAHARSQKIDISDIVGLKTFVNSEFCPRFLLDDPTEENLGFGLQGKSVYILSTSSADFTKWYGDKYLKFERITGVKGQFHNDLTSWVKYLNHLEKMSHLH